MLEVPVVSIVDDDESVRTAMGSLVRSLGYRVYIFDCAEAFLASPRLQETSCLIADMLMPGMTGPQLQAELHDQGWRFPIIFFTAHSEDRYRKPAEAAGAAGFFAKPVGAETIIKC